MKYVENGIKLRRGDKANIEQRFKTTGRVLKENALVLGAEAGKAFMGGLHPTRSGNISGNTGYLGSTIGSLQPTLYINFPNAKTPTYGPVINGVRQNLKYGYPCNRVSSDELFGQNGEAAFAQFKNVKLTFTTYDDILDEITNLLETGVYI